MELIVNYKCLECGSKNEVTSQNRKIQCPACKTVNDFWLDNEQPPENHR